MIILCSISCKSKNNKDGNNDLYDVVIVGAGLSGLSAAYNLKDKNIIILEKDSRVGGRIYDKTYKGINYSMGAHIGYHSIMTPKELSGQLQMKKVNMPRGVFSNGKLYLGKTTLDAVASLLSEKEKEYFLKYRNGQIKFNDFLKNIENFNKIGYEFGILMESYEDDPNLGYLMDLYYKDFNLIEYYKKILFDKIQTLSKVILVESRDDFVEITYLKNEKQYKVITRSVVVATPADVSVRIVKDLPEKTIKFLSLIKYYGYGQLTLIFENHGQFVPFTYLQVLRNTLFLVYRHEIHGGKYVFYSLYYPEDFFVKNSENILDMSLKKLSELTIGNFTKKELIHHDIVIWENLFSNVSSETYEKFWDKEVLYPKKGIFIAGDYTMGGDSTSKLTSEMLMKKVENNGMPGYEFLPYGVFQAWLSGVNSSNHVNKYLEDKRR